MQTYGGKSLREPNSCETMLPMLGYCTAGLGRHPVNMLCVPRSWSASPCVIERITQILSATCAVFLRCSQKWTPSMLVFTLLNGPRYSIGASIFGSNDSCAAMPPGRKILITDCAFALAIAD